MFIPRSPWTKGRLPIKEMLVTIRSIHLLVRYANIGSICPKRINPNNKYHP